MTAKPKVLFAFHLLDLSGAPILLANLIPDLGVDATAYCPTDGPLAERLRARGIPLVHSFEPRDYDLIFANTVVSYPAVKRACDAGVPTVWYIHESEPQAFGDWPETERQLERCDRLVFASFAAAAPWLSRWHAKVSVVQACIPAGTTAIGRAEARETLGYAPNDFVVLNVGTIEHRKNQRDLVEAAKRLPIRVALVGRTTHPDQTAGAPANVTVYPPTPAVHAHYAAADLYACTSLVECFPLTVLEAKRAGLPVVVHPSFGIREQIVEDYHGVYYPAGDVDELCRKIERMRNDAAWRRSLSRPVEHLISQSECCRLMSEIIRVCLAESAVDGPRAGHPPAFVSTNPETLPTFGELFDYYGSDKNSTHSYGPMYDSLLTPEFRNSAKRVLEVGIAEGCSLRAWRDAMPAATIEGWDIDPNSCRFRRSRIETYRRDATIVDPTERYDLVVDDGSHDPRDQARTLALLWPSLEIGGLYVVEDLIPHARVSSILAASGIPQESFDLQEMDLREVKGRWDDRAFALRKKEFVSRGIPDSPPDPRPIVVYHVAAMGNWQEVVTEQLHCLREAGLTEVRVSHVGLGLDWLLAECSRLGVACDVVRSDPNTDHYETFAIAEVERLAKIDFTDRPILYMHTKGVSAPENGNKRQWRRAMMRHVVMKWRENVRAIADGYDAVGVDWCDTGEKHFSGNFWIASPNWIRKLGDYCEYHRSKDRMRFSCELWIGSTDGCREKSLVWRNAAVWVWDESQFAAAFADSDFIRRIESRA